MGGPLVPASGLESTGGAGPPPRMESRMTETPMTDRRAALTLVVLVVVIGAMHTTWICLDRDPPRLDELRELGKLDRALDRLKQGTPAAVASLATLGTPHPPALTLSALPLYALSGRDFRFAKVVNVLYLMLAMAGTYWLARRGFPAGAALTMAGLVGIAPFAFAQTRELLLEAPLTAMLPFLLGHGVASEGFRRRVPSFLLGLVAGWMMLVKWTAVAFLLGPLLLVLVDAIRPGRSPARTTRRREQAAGMLLFLLGASVAAPWYIAHTGDVFEFLRFNETLPPEYRSWWMDRGNPLSYLFYLFALDDLLGLGLAIAVLIGLVGLLLRPAWRTRTAGYAVAALAGAYVMLSLVQLKDPRHLGPVGPALVWVGSSWILTALPAGRSRLAGGLALGLTTAMAGLLPAIGIAPRQAIGVAWKPELGVTLLPAASPPNRSPWPLQTVIDGIARQAAARPSVRAPTVAVLTKVQGVNRGAFVFHTRDQRLPFVFVDLDDAAFDLDRFRRADYVVATTLPGRALTEPSRYATIEATRWLTGGIPPGPPPQLQEFLVRALPVDLDLIVFRRRGAIARGSLSDLVKAIRAPRPADARDGALNEQLRSTPERPADDGAAFRRRTDAGTLRIWEAPTLDSDGGRLWIARESEGRGLEVCIWSRPGAGFQLVAGAHRALQKHGLGWARIADPRVVASGTLDASGGARIAIDGRALVPAGDRPLYLQALLQETPRDRVTNWVAITRK